MNQLKKICVCRIDRIGDLVMTTPALKVIRTNWPKSKITLLVSETNSKVLINSNLIDEIIIIDKSYSLIKKLRILKKIRKKSFNLYINFSPTNLSYMFCYFSNATNKATLIFLSRYKKNLSKIFQRFLAMTFCNYVHVVNRRLLLNKKQEIHQTKMMLVLIEKILKKSFLYPNLQIPIVSNLGKQIKLLFNKKIITFHLSNRWINNYYTIEDFKKLINKIKYNKKFIFFLTTEKSNDNTFKELIKEYPYLYLKEFFNHKLINDKMKKNNIFVLNNYEYNDWISIIKQSHQVITPDSGCAHIAAASKVFVTVIYNADNTPEYIYKEYGPWMAKHTKLIFSKKNNINKLIQDQLN